MTTFDTLTAARRLETSGLAPAQAEAITEMMRDAVTEGLATKTDIADLRADIARLETRLLLAILAVGGIIIAAIKLLPDAI